MLNRLRSSNTPICTIFAFVWFEECFSGSTQETIESFVVRKIYLDLFGLLTRREIVQYLAETLRSRESDKSRCEFKFLQV